MRKLFVLLLACMLVAVSAGGAFAVVYGEAGYELEGYDEDSAWEIDSASTLAKVRDDINAQKIKILKYYKLTADIDITSSADWEPIGKSEEAAFTGHFNGNGHTITVSISRTDTEYAGLFGYWNNRHFNIFQIFYFQMRNRAFRYFGFKLIFCRR